MQVLVVNAGSSSVKLRVVGDRAATIASRDLQRSGSPDGADEPGALADALDEVLTASGPVDAAGHRIVHGGTRFQRPLLIDATADEQLGALADLAPLHNPPGLAAVHALRDRRPELPQVACFDTAFHATLPPEATTFAIPRRWREEWGLRRYGFHGLSHAWASRRAAALLDRPSTELRLVTAHLGAGASLAAVVAGRSVDTTMGFTPLDGLVMATRSGRLDPGALLWVLRHGRVTVDDAEDDLEHRSGLAGLCAASGGDLRQVMAAADAGDEEARVAYRVYLHRLRAEVAAMVAAMGGMEALVFTGGAGEASARLRADTCEGLAFLGVRPPDASEPAPGEGSLPDRVLTAGGSGPAVVVVHAREDLEIDRQVRELVAAPT